MRTSNFAPSIRGVRTAVNHFHFPTFTIILNPFLPNVPFWSPWKHQKTKGFLMFSGGSKGNIGKKRVNLTFKFIPIITLQALWLPMFFINPLQFFFHMTAFFSRKWRKPMKSRKYVHHRKHILIAFPSICNFHTFHVH